MSVNVFIQLCLGPHPTQLVLVGEMASSQCADASASSDGVLLEWPLVSRRFTPGTWTALDRAQTSVKQFMESSDPHTVLHCLMSHGVTHVSRCMDILDADLTCSISRG